MTLREAVKTIKDAVLCEDKHVALLCSFEPVHLATYLQAYLVERFPAGAPKVRSFGYDQLDRGLAETVSVFKHFPVLLFFSWEDLHPALSWRSRAAFGNLEPNEVSAHGQNLTRKLAGWMENRGSAESYVVVPPLELLPTQDACLPSALGPVGAAALEAMGSLAGRLAALGGRILRLPSFDLDLRGLLQSGCPLTPECSEFTARQFVEMAFRRTGRKKALVVDLDGTLWAGIIGEDGVEKLSYRPEGKGYPFHIFQKVMLKLKREGVFLAFCSKNNPEDVLGIFDSFDMPLKLADFSVWRCNWEAKARGIEAIAQELNIGCDSIVFVDDNPAELAAVSSRLPEVTVLRTPDESAGWQSLFAELQSLFATWRVSTEDKIRALNPVADRKRDADMAESGTPGVGDLSHLRSLRLEVTINPDAFSDPRSLELINKTNQFNLTGTRLSQGEWLQWTSTPGAFCISARLQDRYGDFGTICVLAGLRQDENVLTVRQFVLSCRAFGRGVESIVLGELLTLHPAAWICGSFKNTGKNGPAQNFLAGLGCNVTTDGEWLLGGDSARERAESVCQGTGASVRAESRVEVSGS